MRQKPVVCFMGLAVAFAVGGASIAGQDQRQAQEVVLSEGGQKLQEEYSAMLAELRAEIEAVLPKASDESLHALKQAKEAVKLGESAVAEADKNFGAISSGKALIAHAEGKWIGGADKGIAKAQEAIKAAKTPVEREAAEKELEKWRANRDEGEKALAERKAAYEKAMANEPQLKKACDEAKAVLSEARNQQRKAADALLRELASVVDSDKLDAKLVKGAVLAHGTPQGLAEFAQQGPEKAALIQQLLGDTGLMKDMLVAGGARFGQYGRAMEIYMAIRKASPKSHSGNLQRLALGTGLEHARPIRQSGTKGEVADAMVDPVKRYLHYENAFLSGELDPAFANLTAWEYRHVVNSDAPDEILQWGRTMLRNYRPDHIYNPDYGWRYVSSVRSEVPYGSQNVKHDDPARHQYQNIIRNGGICGRRAFYGRFILRSFGIPTWGVTQRAHAALSHWTPKGWVVNLGAGYSASWWDKDDVSMSGTQFLRETQARAHGDAYLRVLRADWVSRILGEEAYNDRKRIAGGFWSGMANDIATVLAAEKVALGPLGQELGEANDKDPKAVSADVSEEDRQVQVDANTGTITIPAVANAKGSGKAASMKSFAGGMQLHVLGGYKTIYQFESPAAGRYQFVARVATVQTGQKFGMALGEQAQAVESEVPYTLGMWEFTKPIEVSLEKGANTLHFECKEGSRGVTIKDFVLTPSK